jgi:hypothetical protein
MRAPAAVSGYAVEATPVEAAESGAVLLRLRLVPDDAVAGEREPAAAREPRARRALSVPVAVPVPRAASVEPAPPHPKPEARITSERAPMGSKGG